MNKEKILQEHLDFKRTSVKKEEKIKDIERYLRLFITSSKKPLSKYKEPELNKFLNSLDFSIRTINDIKTYLKVFIKWYYDDYSSRFRNIESICKNQKPPRTYTPDQMLKEEEIWKMVKGENILYWKLYILLLFYGGFRPSECIRLKWNNIMFEKDGVIIKMRTTKTNKDFYKSVPEEVEHMIKEWKKYNDSEYVFPSDKNLSEHLHVKTALRRVKLLGQRILKKKVGLYQIRHSIGTLKYNSDLKDEIVAMQMGHSKSMRNTYTNLNDEQMKTNARKIWSKPKELPKEKKHKLERDVEELKKIVRELGNQLKEIKGDNFPKPKNTYKHI